MATPALFTLPPELQEKICDYMDTSATGSLRLTCRHFANTLFTRLLRRLTIAVTSNITSVKKAISKLQTLAARNGDFLFVQELEIMGILPTFRSDQKYGDFTGPEEITKLLTEQLFDAIVSLKGVNHVLWRPQYFDTEASLQLVVSAIGSLPNLESIELRLNGIGNATLSLDGIHSRYLKSITIASPRFNAGGNPALLITSLASLIARSPNLTKLSFDGDRAYTRDAVEAQSFTLRKLFEFCSSDAPPLNIRELSLQACSLSLDDSIIPHIANLKSLSFKSASNPIPFHLPSALDDDFLAGRLAPPTCEEEDVILGTVWDKLKAARIEIESFEHDHPTISCLDYLASFRGLRVLLLSSSGFYDGAASDAMATVFYRDILPMHAPTLEKLSIEVLYEGKWSISKENIAAVMQCARLEILSVGILESDLLGDELGISTVETSPEHLQPHDQDIIKLLIDGAIFFMPRLVAMRISSSDDEGERYAWCGTGAEEDAERVEREMARSMELYRLPPLGQRRVESLPKIVVGRQFFVPIEGKGGVLAFAQREYMGWYM